MRSMVEGKAQPLRSVDQHAVAEVVLDEILPQAVAHAADAGDFAGRLVKEVGQRIAEDEENFLDRSGTRMFLVEEKVSAI
jgi:hypothetical protein